MEYRTAEEVADNIINNVQNVDKESADEFQKFLYELFEKNGILNDLRAYLRSHIVQILNNTQTGNLPSCQQKFTERLDLTTQAINILIVEYLLRQEFSYSLSVFLSELPLGNMAFQFSKTLMDHKDNPIDETLKFQQSDIWAILNYLGVQCSSEDVINVIKLYESEKGPPLISCILKCLSLCGAQTSTAEDNISVHSVTSSMTSLSDNEDKCRRHYKNESSSFHSKCRHYAICKTCQKRITNVKDKYRKKKKATEENSKFENKSDNQSITKEWLKNINVVERSFIDEMFEELKSVYESEVAMIREEKDDRVKQLMSSYTLEIEKQRSQMAEEFKDRERRLTMNLQEKKRFLWCLARSLRDQHQRMSHAMLVVQEEGKRLTDKEENLKKQLVEAENMLKKKGDEMQEQVSKELMVLEEQLVSMSNERENISKEKIELQKLRSNETMTLENNASNNDMVNYYELLKRELEILKKYIDTVKFEPKCLIERSTSPDHSVTSRTDVILNNGHREYDSRNLLDVSGSSRSCRDGGNVEEVKPKLVVNDLKKRKNINYSSDTHFQSTSMNQSYDRCHSSVIIEGATDTRDVVRELLDRVQEENKQLRTFASQQRTHIDELATQRARLQAELAAATATATATARRAPPPALAPLTLQRASTSGAAFCYGQRKGGGEQLSLFSDANTRIVVPGERIPFVGTVDGRRIDGARHLMNQWRLLRKLKPNTDLMTDVTSRDGARHFRLTSDAAKTKNSSFDPRKSHALTSQIKPSHKPVDVKLKSDDQPLFPLKAEQSTSGNSSFVLNEAKIRLRKLEIEAEEVEKSYMDFRRRQSEMKDVRCDIGHVAVTPDVESKDLMQDLDTSQKSNFNKSKQTNINDSNASKINIMGNMNSDFDRYLRDYQDKYDIGKTYFQNRTAAVKFMNPIPVNYSEHENNVNNKFNEDLIETSLLEFRKYYHRKQDNVRDANVRTAQSNTSKDEALSPIVVKHSNVDINTTETSKSEPIDKDEKPKDAEIDIHKSDSDKIDNSHEDNVNNDENEESKQPQSLKLQEENNIIEDTVVSEGKIENLKIQANTNSKPAVIDPENCLKNVQVVVEGSIETIHMSDTLLSNSKKNPIEMTVIITPRSFTNSSIHENEKEKPIESEMKPANVDKENNVIDNNKRESIENDDVKTKETVDNTVNDAHNEIVKTNSDVEKDSISSQSVSSLRVDVEFPDNLSADVDNSSRFEYSPISLSKIPDDDNFWDP